MINWSDANPGDVGIAEQDEARSWVQIPDLQGFFFNKSLLIMVKDTFIEKQIYRKNKPVHFMYLLPVLTYPTKPNQTT